LGGAPHASTDRAHADRRGLLGRELVRIVHRKGLLVAVVADAFVGLVTVAIARVATTST
jgi:hypothetical protein